MSSQVPKHVAIIGAGLSGLALAIALQRQSIPCTIYELRSEEYSVGGGIMLGPNALRVLDHIGVWDRIKKQGYHFETLAFMTSDLEIKERFWFGDEKLYGYPGLRIFRQPLVETLRTMVTEAGVVMRYGAKFSHVISESEQGVSFALADGETIETSLLIGADGIHSRVRRYLYPDLKPEFAGFMGLTGALPTSKIRLPEGMHVPATIMAKPGAFVIAPQAVDGSDMFFGIQAQTQERSREEWDALYSNKDELASMLRKDYESWPDVAQSVLENLVPERLNIWPFYQVPKIENWASEKQKVLILGDAAHAVPPTTGQGVNQAFEDVYMLSLLLARVSEKVAMSKALEFWMEYRHARLDGILRLTRLMNAKRLPPAERAKIEQEEVWAGTADEAEGAAQMKWLYGPDIHLDVEKWVAERT